MGLVVVAGLLLAPLAGRAAEPLGGLRSPVRLTAGDSNDFMGVLAPDGRTVFFVTDRSSTTQILRQDAVRGGPSPLVEIDADVTWPRPSPDGNTLLYISYREDAAGDVCLLDLQKGGHRCITGPATADVQAFWYPDGQSVGVVQREGLHGDFRLRRLPVAGGPGEMVVERNLTAPALVGGGQRVVYVPIGRERKEVGPAFALTPARGLAFFEIATRAVTLWQPGLPGATGFPVPSPDGAWLYFTQYLNDTNDDGAIDGDDHGVLFRVALNAATGIPQGGAVPEQLTSARWNCLYPSPSPDRLLATCSRAGSLDVYSLPLDGVVPPDWDVARLDAEAAVARDDRDALLLLARASTRDTEPRRRLDRLRRLARLHLERDEFVAAVFHLTAARRGLPEGDPVAEWAAVMLQVASHRESERRLVQGQISEQFLASQRDRLAALDAMRPRSRDVVAFVVLARSEILDVLGDKRGALAAFRSVRLQDLADGEVVHEAAARGEHLLDLFQDREGLLALEAILADHPALPAVERLFHADEYVRVLLRGLPESDLVAAVTAAFGRAVPSSNLAFRLRLETILLGVGSRDAEAVRKDLFDLYGQSDAERRKVLVLVTAARAAASDQQFLLYQFVNSWVSGLRRVDVERQFAEGLFRQVALERGFGLRAAGDVSNARGVFWGATLILEALEPHAAFIEARLAEGKDDVSAAYAKRFPDARDPVRLFSVAYLMARDLASRPDDDAARQDAGKALDAARAAGTALPRDAQANLLWGFAAHQAWARSGDPTLAAEADDHYLLAVDLAATDPRIRAAALQGAAELQAGLGNYQIALGHADERLRLPFTTPESELAMRMLQARCLFLTDDEAEAAKSADIALARVQTDPSLSRYAPLVLDRAALYHRLSGDPEGALALYDRLARQPDVPGTDAAWNRYKAQMNRGAAALAAGKATEALGDLDRASATLESLREIPPGAPGPGGAARPRNFTRDDHRLMLLGLRAEALARDGRWAEASKALEARRARLEERVKAADADEDVLELAVTAHRLAEAAWHLGDRAAAARWVREGLGRAASFGERTGTPVTPVGNRLLVDAAALHLDAGVPLATLAPDLGRRMGEALAFMGAHPTPRNGADRFLFEVYLTRLDVAR